MIPLISIVLSFSLCVAAQQGLIVQNHDENHKYLRQLTATATTATTTTSSIYKKINGESQRQRQQKQPDQYDGVTTSSSSSISDIAKENSKRHVKNILRHRSLEEEYNDDKDDFFEEGENVYENMANAYGDGNGDDAFAGDDGGAGNVDDDAGGDADDDIAAVGDDLYQNTTDYPDDDDKSWWGRYMDSQTWYDFDDDNAIRAANARAKEEYGNMFQTAPRYWDALAWGVFSATLTALAVFVSCCFCRKPFLMTCFDKYFDGCCA